MSDLVRTLTSNLKLVAVAVGAVTLFGGTATTVALVDSESPSPNPHATSHATAPTPAESEAPDADETEAPDAHESGAPDAGTRPTDTHGYCVSQAVAAAKAAGKTGQDVAAAAHSCPKPNAEKKAAAAARKAAGQAHKTASHGKSGAAPGRHTG